MNYQTWMEENIDGTVNLAQVMIDGLPSYQFRGYEWYDEYPKDESPWVKRVTVDFGVKIRAYEATAFYVILDVDGDFLVDCGAPICLDDPEFGEKIDKSLADAARQAYLAGWYDCPNCELHVRTGNEQEHAEGEVVS